MAWTRRTRPRQADGVIEGCVDGQLVVLQTRTGDYAGLDGTALHIWQLLAQGITVGELVDTLAVDYTVPRSECAPGVVECLEGLLRQGLLVVEHA